MSAVNTTPNIRKTTYDISHTYMPTPPPSKPLPHHVEVPPPSGAVHGAAPEHHHGCRGRHRPARRVHHRGGRQEGAYGAMCNVWAATDALLDLSVMTNHHT